jgi:hypothetical protein
VNGILRWVSAGAISNAFAKAANWSPVGHRIKLVGVEGPEAGLLEGRSARVTGVLGSELIAELLPCHERGAEGFRRLRLTPRHSGWTPFSLILVGIAVVVQDESLGLEPRHIGVAMAKLSRDQPREQ